MQFTGNPDSITSCDKQLLSDSDVWCFWHYCSYIDMIIHRIEYWSNIALLNASLHSLVDEWWVLLLQLCGVRHLLRFQPSNPIFYFMAHFFISKLTWFPEAVSAHRLCDSSLGRLESHEVRIQTCLCEETSADKKDKVTVGLKAILLVLYSPKFN